MYGREVLCWVHVSILCPTPVLPLVRFEIGLNAAVSGLFLRFSLTGHSNFADMGCRMYSLVLSVVVRFDVILVSLLRGNPFSNLQII